MNNKVTPFKPNPYLAQLTFRFSKTLCISIILLFIFSTIFSVSAKEKAFTKPLRVAVSSNFAPVLKKLVTDFQQTNNIQVQVIAGATGTLYQQIQHGAPFDIYLSADSERPERLEQENKIVAGSRHTYAIGQLALWSASLPTEIQKEKHNNNLSLLFNLNERLAIANPNIAPYGKAAKETLIHLSVWEEIQQKLITGININQTFQQVRAKVVNWGLVANSQLVLNNFKGIVIPTSYHQPLAQQLVIIKRSSQPANAQQFVDYLLSESVQTKISHYGYQRPESIIEQALNNDI